MTGQEVELRLSWDGLELAGSLHLPSEAGPHPAAVMAQGSGPADRNSDGYFTPIRETFLAQGVATFAFDKPGCGASSGDWRNYALQGRAQQLRAAIALVRDHRAVHRERVGVFGHSQGGWLVQKLGGERETVAFAIANSAPTICVREQVLYECEQTLRNNGFTPAQVHDALDLSRAVQEAAASDDTLASVVELLLKPASYQPWYRDFPVLDHAGDWHHLKLLINEPHDPLSDLKRTTCPLLVIYGGLDTLVPPWQGAEESGVALAQASSPDTTVAVFPTGDHRIQNPDTGAFVDGYLRLLGDWIRDQTR